MAYCHVLHRRYMAEILPIRRTIKQYMYRKSVHDHFGCMLHVVERQP